MLLSVRRSSLTPMASLSTSSKEQLSIFEHGRTRIDPGSSSLFAIRHNLVLAEFATSTTKIYIINKLLCYSEMQDRSYY